VKTNDYCLIKYVCTSESKQPKKEIIGHLVTAGISDRDVIQW
jgi:hypothetical protein